MELEEVKQIIELMDAITSASLSWNEKGGPDND